MKTLMRFDTFRRLDKDFHEGTYHGAGITLITWLLMIFLMWSEIRSMFLGDYTTEVRLDDNMEAEVSINFDITMLDLPCRFAQLNLWDIFENYRINVTKGITQRRNLIWVDGKLEPGQKVLHNDKKIKYDNNVELDYYGHHAVDLVVEARQTMEEVWKAHVEKYVVLIVNFYASWCYWSRLVQPIYEEAAVTVDAMIWVHKKTTVKLVAIDCAKQSKFCDESGVTAYPTIVYFLRGEKHAVYENDRSVEEIVKWTSNLVRKIDRSLPNTFHKEACQLVGRVTVPRVPGNMLVQAGSEDYSISPSMTNVSHHIAHLSFGPEVDPWSMGLPKEATSLYNPLDGKTFIVEKLHHAPHHFINIVPNVYSKRGLFFGRSSTSIQAYQMAVADRMKVSAIDEVPEAQFTYRFSNVVLDHANRGQGLYHVVTNFCAILGGTYAVMEFTNALMNQVLSKRAPRELIK